MLRLGRQAEAQSWMKERSAEFVGEPADHILLLGIQGRLNEGCPWLPSAQATEAEREWCWFAKAVGDITSGKSAKSHLEDVVAKAPNDSVIALAAKIELERLGLKSTK